MDETVEQLMRAIEAWEVMARQVQHGSGVLGTVGTCRTWCGDDCINPRNDTRHCGACGVACSDGVACVNMWCADWVPQALPDKGDET